MPLARDIWKSESLDRAWRSVLENGRASRSADTRREIAAFAEDAPSHLRKLQQALPKGRFKFQPARGARISRGANKRPRPLVIAPIESRIVQRSILDRLQSLRQIREWTDNPYSFGGIAKNPEAELAAVPAAIHAAKNAICSGGQYFIRSDISDFFTKIPKKTVLEKIETVVTDARFMSLLEQAVSLELSNMNELRKDLDLFPIYEVGVAQGCSLSPLMGNLLLTEFDHLMNEGQCTCLRYIDDFIIIGTNKENTWDAFRQALRYLRQFKMSAYDPKKVPEKAQYGETSRKIEFLGVELRPGIIRPSKKSRNRLVQSVQEAFERSAREFKNASGEKWDYQRSLSFTLRTVDGIVSGWGNQYFFCNQEAIWKQLDAQIDEQIRAYLGRYRTHRQQESGRASRRLLGVRSLTDCKRKPFAWKAD